MLNWQYINAQNIYDKKYYIWHDQILYDLQMPMGIRRGRGKIISEAPMTSLFSNDKTNKRRTVLQNVKNTSKRGVMVYTRPNFNGALQF